MSGAGFQKLKKWYLIMTAFLTIPFWLLKVISLAGDVDWALHSGSKFALVWNFATSNKGLLIVGVLLLAGFVTIHFLSKQLHEISRKSENPALVQVGPPLLERPININIENKPVFNPHIDQRPVNYQTQTQLRYQEQRVEAVLRDPVFEYTGDARFPLYGIDWRTSQIIREGPTPDEISQIPDYITVAHAVLIPFYYRPDRYVDHTVYLSAHVSVYTPDQKSRLKRVNDGIWDGNPLKSSSRIQTGHTLELIAAFAPIATEGILSAEYHQETQEDYMGKIVYDAPRLEAIKGISFSICVELLPKRMSKDPFPIQPFWFNLDLVTGAIAAPRLTITKPPSQD